MPDRLATQLGLDPERVARLQGLAPPVERRAPIVEAAGDEDRFDAEDPTLTVSDQRLVEAVASAWQIEAGPLADATANVLNARAKQPSRDALADGLGLDPKRVRDLQSGARRGAAA